MAKEMKKPVSAYTDQADLRVLMANVRERGREDIWREAFSKLCSLQGMDQTDPLHRDFYQTLAAYEELLTEKNGRTTRASRTRQKLQKKGVVRCLEDWAISLTPTDGYNLLIERGMVELTGEFLVQKYPERFSVEAVTAAKSRLG